MLRPTRACALALVPLLVAACGSADEAAGDDVQIVATTSVMGDLASKLTDCAGGSTDTIMPAGADPHEFAASSREVADMAKADLVVANGLGLEEGMLDTLESVEADGVEIFEVAPLLDPLEFGEGEGGHDHEEGEEHSDDEGHEDEHDHEHGPEDPHVWHDATRMAEAAELLGDELADVTGDDAYSDCGAEVHDELIQLDSEVRDIMSAIAEEDRVLVTDHDAFRYLASAYDFEIAGTVIPSPSTLAEPSSSELAELVEVIEEAGVPALFSNNASNPDLVKAVAAEVGNDVEVVQLYVDSLGPADSDGATYEEMMRSNAQRIADTLGGPAGAE